MKRHATDMVSLVFGFLFVAVTLWWAVDRYVDIELDIPHVGWIAAGALIVLGLIGVAASLRGDRSPAPTSAPPVEPASDPWLTSPVPPPPAPASFDPPTPASFEPPTPPAPAGPPAPPVWEPTGSTPVATDRPEPEPASWDEPSSDAPDDDRPQDDRPQDDRPEDDRPEPPPAARSTP
jgi:hypothetical protein